MTISSSSFPFLIAFVVVFAVVASAVQLRRRSVTGLTGRQSLRAAIHLQRYAIALEYYGLRPAEIRAHVDELRADLADAGPEGADGLLERLGPPRTMAAGVAGHLLRPSWLRGCLWLAVALFGTLGAAVLATEAFLGGFEPLAAAGQMGSWGGAVLSVDATMGGDGHASTIGFGGAALLVVPAAAFVVGSRAWRLRSR